MNNIIERVWKRDSMVNIEDLRGSAFQNEKAGHTFIISGIDGDGNTVSLSGTVAGSFLRPDGTTVAIVGSASGGKVSITLPENCYDVPGKFGLTIFLTENSQKTAIYAAIGAVARTSSSTAAPGTTADVVDLVNAIATAVATIPASYTDLMAAVAPTYSTSALYAVGSYAWYSGKLYRCTTAITSGETWTSAHWTQANLGSDVSDLKSAVTRIDHPGNNVVQELIYTMGGYYNTSNQYQSSADWGYTDLIPCVAGKKYFVNTPTNMYINFYKSDKTFISGVAANSAVAPSNAAYIRLGIYKTRIETARLTVDTEYEDYVGKLRTESSYKSPNLIGFKDDGTSTSNSVTLTLDKDDEYFGFNGTASANTSFSITFGGTILKGLDALTDGETVVLSTKIISGKYYGTIHISLASKSETDFRLDRATEKSFTYSKTNHVNVNFYIENGTECDNLKVCVQLEKGSSATEWKQNNVYLANEVEAIERTEKLSGWFGEDAKNLLGIKALSGAKGNGVKILYDPKDGSVTLDGTASADFSSTNSFGYLYQAMDATDGDYLTLSVDKVSGTYTGNLYVSSGGQTDANIRLDRKTSITFEYDSSRHTGITVFASSGAAFSNFKSRIQIEKGRRVTAWKLYGTKNAMDDIARSGIEKANEELDKQTTTEYSRDFNIGLFTDGVPTAGNYRLRSKHFFPLKALQKITWDNALVAALVLYDAHFGYVRSSSYIGGNYLDASMVDTSGASYFKVLFSYYPASTITLDALEDNNFQMFLYKVYMDEYQHEIENGVLWEINERNLKKLCGNKFSFAIQTDTHYYDESEQWYASSMKNLDKKIGFDFIANLGDIIRGYDNDTASISYRDYQLAVNGMCNNVDTQTFMLMGNHDNNSVYATIHEDIDSAFFPNELYALFVRQGCRNVDYLNKSKFYGYKDFDDIRVVFLNSSDLPYQELDEHDINVNEMRFSTEQVEWFRDVALNTDKKVLVLCHGSIAPKWELRLVDSYLIANYTEAFIDNGGTFIGFVCGHHHKTDATVYKKATNILCDNGGQICEVFAVDTENSLIKTQQLGNNFTAQRIFHYGLQSVSESVTLTSSLSGTLTWESSDTDVATVSSGTVTKVATGSCAVTATDENGNSEQWAIVT